MTFLTDQLPLTFDMLPAALSMLGAFYVARHDSTSWRGWLLWLASNVLWICWGLSLFGKGGPVWGIVGQNIVFFGTSIQGFIKSRRKFTAESQACATPVADAAIDKARPVSTAA